MKKILVASHGKLASGIMNSIELFAGLQENVTIVDAYVDDSDYSKVIEAFLDNLLAGEQAIIFTDIFGGSVNQKVVELVNNYEKEIYIITGFNLPVLLEIVLCSTAINEAVIDEIIGNCQVKRVEGLDSIMDTSCENFFSIDDRE